MENTKINYCLNNISKKAVHLDCSKLPPNDSGDAYWKSRAYSKQCRLFLAAIAEDIGATLLPHKGHSWGDAFGTLAKGNRYVQISFPCYDSLEYVGDEVWKNNPRGYLVSVMYRDQETSAYDSKGRNQWTSFAGLPDALAKAFDRAPIFGF